MTDTVFLLAYSASRSLAEVRARMADTMTVAAIRRKADRYWARGIDLPRLPDTAPPRSSDRPALTPHPDGEFVDGRGDSWEEFARPRGKCKSCRRPARFAAATAGDEKYDHRCPDCVTVVRLPGE